MNYLIEQDLRGIKFRARPMLGFKNYDCAAATIAGIKLLRLIGKNQFSLRHLHIKDHTAPTIWNAVLAACTKGQPRGHAMLALGPYDTIRTSNSDYGTTVSIV
ncbi:hypothetical protein [Acidicapsa acidisoli]|uniref:hypothetical protein n=1 Tax=Acidicapsa acidisoli TaxID=1615681 RepID=UPI0037BFC7B0